MGRSSIPPTIPYSQVPPPPLPLPLPLPRTFSASLHSRSLSQPTFFSFDSLPPLSPSPYRKTSSASSISDTADLSAATATGDGLQNRDTYCRSRSDLLPAVKPGSIEDRDEGTLARKPENNLGEDLFDSFFNLDGFGVVESSDHRGDEMESRGSGHSKNGACSSESEAESCAIDCAVVGESAPAAMLSRHFRSISMDGLVDRVNFCENSLRVSPSPGSKRSKSSECDLIEGTFSLEFGNGEFSGAELKKIMADKRLEEIALTDPKRAKRVLANRYSAARSKERKGDSAGVATQNNELKIRLQAMEQQAQLRDALNEALTSEVQRLRLATAKLDDSLSLNR